MVTDQIADMFNRIRNAIQARKRTVDIPASRLKREITRILFENHFISKYAFVTDKDNKSTIKILLKYSSDNENAIRGLKRVSTPGCRKYVNANKIPRILNGLGIAIISTSKGVLTDKECRELKVGGEIVGIIW